MSGLVLALCLDGQYNALAAEIVKGQLVYSEIPLGDIPVSEIKQQGSTGNVFNGRTAQRFYVRCSSRKGEAGVEGDGSAYDYVGVRV